MRLYFVFILIFGVCIALSYQNCSPVYHRLEQEASQGVDLASLSDLKIETILNAPKEGKLLVGADLPKYHLSFDPNSAVVSKDLGHGAKLEIVNDAGRVLRFTPAKNRRDKFDSKIYLLGSDSGPISALVLAIVDNGLSEIQPAVAVRSSGCITCHAQVSSSFITDFGFGSPWFGKSDYGADVLHPPPDGAAINFMQGSVYGDHSGSLSSMHLLNGSQIWVPKANINQASLMIGNPDVKTFGDLVRYRFANPTSGIEGVSAPSNKPEQIKEKSQIMIGAPTEGTIKAILEGKPWIYYPDLGQPEEISGLTVTGTTAVLSGNAECSGDLVIDGVLVIKNLSLKSYRGCRIYVTKTVFFQGSLTYLSSTKDFDLANLQITSSRAILMGMGKTAVNYRFINMWTEPSYHTRQFPNSGKGPGSAWENNHFIMADTQMVSNAGLISDLFIENGNLTDASDVNRKHEFSRLLLNAPHVHSRYVGNFRGAVIGEIGLFSIGNFQFEFDVMFRGVSVFPLISIKDVMLNVAE